MNSEHKYACEYLLKMQYSDLVSFAVGVGTSLDMDDTPANTASICDAILTTAESHLESENEE